MDSENIIICFCKHPEPGMVKSRLAKDLDNLQATEVYKALLNSTLKNIQKTDIKTYLYCYPNINHSFLEENSSKYNFKLKNQSSGDLGAKMFNAINAHLNKNCNIVLIGSDCPELNDAYILQAFNCLNQNNDIVLGPTVDGGYALIGMKKIKNEIFEDIAWSTDKVLHQTERKIFKLGLKSATLPVVRDLDTIEDYVYFSTHKEHAHIFN